MKFYKNVSNKVFSFDANLTLQQCESFAHEALTEINYTQAQALINGELTHDELLAKQKTVINAAFSEAIALLVTQYPQDEISSWPKQEQEARAYVANNTAQTPLLDSIAAARQIAKSELVQRIIAKAELYAQISGQLIGYRQKLEDQLDALPNNATKAQIEAVVWVTPS